MKVGVIGTGHVGLATAGSLATIGHTVAATDSDREKLELLARGGMPFHEAGLEQLIHDGVELGRLSFTSDPAPTVEESDVVFICVGTPPRAGGDANLLAVERSAELVARHATAPVVVAEKSTVPAGTADRLARSLSQHRPDIRFFLVSNPEFFREGSAVEDSLRPSRILVGSDSLEAIETMRNLYAPMVEAGARWIQTDLRTAELAKHACNAFLAMKVSYANALARLCELAGADVARVTEVMEADPRIGQGHLGAGLGYGGSCFPKDLVAFERLATRLGYDFPLLREIGRINEEAVQAAFHKVEEALWNLEEKRIALLGLAFKPGTDDIRFAPALSLAARLLEAGSHVVGYDPLAAPNAKAEVPGLELATDPYAALDGAHCAVICTEWEELRALEPSRMREVMAFPVVVDGRNLLQPEKMAEEGFTYLPTGRPPVRP